jgi:hypothetical protein
MQVGLAGSTHTDAHRAHHDDDVGRSLSSNATHFTPPPPTRTDGDDGRGQWQTTMVQVTLTAQQLFFGGSTS